MFEEVDANFLSSSTLATTFLGLPLFFARMLSVDEVSDFGVIV
jgi:hypothetical protein